MISAVRRGEAAVAPVENLTGNEWRGRVGGSWAAEWARTDRSFAELTGCLVDAIAAALPPHGGTTSRRVLDIECGAGETSLRLADARPDLRITGLDISEELVRVAQGRAHGRTNLQFVWGDAGHWRDEAPFEAAFSRHGVMFFDDPVAAFANLHRLAAPGGRLHFACWQDPADNLWATLPLQTLAALLPTQPDADPHAPGPFAFADPARVEAILTSAGWQDVTFDDLPITMTIGEGDDPVVDAVHFNLRIGPAARLVRDAGPAAEAQAPALLAAALEPYLTGETLGLPGAVWLVSARA